MKKIIQNLVNKLGYQVARRDSMIPSGDPFDVLSFLCRDVSSPIIFDVGAHEGQTALAFRKVFPSATIYSLEPFPASFSRLCLATDLDSGIKTFNLGLSDQNSVLPFCSNSSSATNSLLDSDDRYAQTWGEGLLETQNKIMAEFRTLDSFLADQGIPKINILKLDVQGAEYRVMQGALEACKRGQIDTVYTEIILQPTYCEQKRFDEALTVFYSAGFDLHGIYNPILTDSGRLAQVDVIFAKI